MYVVVAIAVIVLVIVLAWRGLGSSPRGSMRGGISNGPRSPRTGRSTAPDDDQDFLSEIDRKLRGEDRPG